MNKDLIGKAAWITMAATGVIVDRYEHTDNGLILYMSVPKTSYEFGSGEIIAKTTKRCLSKIGVKFADCRYKIRDEHWTKEKELVAEREAKQYVGY